MVDTQISEAPTPVAPDRGMPVRWVVLVVLMVWAFGLRLTHITQAPLDFHATRQYNSANLARYFYFRTLDDLPPWKMAMATQNKPPLNEPPLLEMLAVQLYTLAGGENLALPRAVSALCWTLAALYLFLLGRRLFSPNGALLAAGVYLFLPYVVTATRTFQPDPLMTALMVVALYAIYRHHEAPTGKRAVIAGVLAGLSVLVKLVSVFFLVAVFLALAIARVTRTEGGRRWWRVACDPQAWLVGLLTLAPAVFWYIIGVLTNPGLANQAGKSFFLNLWFTGDFWLRWSALAANVFGVLLPSHTLAWLISGWLLLGLGLLGVIVCRDAGARRLLLGGWVGYLLYGLVFDYHIHTHDYYTLPFVPILALSLGALAARVGTLRPFRPLPVRLTLAAALLVGVFVLAGQQARALAFPQIPLMVQAYEEIGQWLDHSTHTLFLTQDYGYPLRYHGMLYGAFWPSLVDQAVGGMRGAHALTTAERLREMTARHAAEYFIVTDPYELAQQPELARLLGTGFPVLVQQENIRIYDLRPDLHPDLYRAVSHGRTAP